MEEQVLNVTHEYSTRTSRNTGSHRKTTYITVAIIYDEPPSRYVRCFFLLHCRFHIYKVYVVSKMSAAAFFPVDRLLIDITAI